MSFPGCSRTCPRSCSRRLDPARAQDSLAPLRVGVGERNSADGADGPRGRHPRACGALGAHANAQGKAGVRGGDHVGRVGRAEDGRAGAAVGGAATPLIGERERLRALPGARPRDKRLALFGGSRDRRQRGVPGRADTCPNAKRAPARAVAVAVEGANAEAVALVATEAPEREHAGLALPPGAGVVSVEAVGIRTRDVAPGDGDGVGTNSRDSEVVGTVRPVAVMRAGRRGEGQGGGARDQEGGDLGLRSGCENRQGESMRLMTA